MDSTATLFLSWPCLSGEQPGLSDKCLSCYRLQRGPCKHDLEVHGPMWLQVTNTCSVCVVSGCGVITCQHASPSTRWLLTWPCKHLWTHSGVYKRGAPTGLWLGLCMPNYSSKRPWHIKTQGYLCLPAVQEEWGLDRSATVDLRDRFSLTSFKLVKSVFQ